jgi:thiamine kinase-like enzyme
MKISEKSSFKENKVYNFLNKYNVAPILYPFYADSQIILYPFYADSQIIVFKYVNDFKDESIKNCLDLIVNYHNNLLLIEDECKKEFEKPDFLNRDKTEFLNRLKKHEDLVGNYWRDVEELVDFSKKNKYDFYPKILLHGDLQGKNIQIDSKGNRYFIDFEDAYYDFPSWDISRALMDIESSEVELFIKNYVSKINISNKEKLIYSIERDFVIRVITESIGRQQRMGIDRAKPYLKFYKQKFRDKIKEIIKRW